MKLGKRMMYTFLALVLIVAMLPVLPGMKVNAEEARAIPEIRLSVGDGQATPNYKAGEKVTFTVKVKNNGTKEAQNVRITPVIDNE